MAILTIRDLDDELKQSLRIRAAHGNRSMEEEARQILRAALTPVPLPTTGLAQRIRARFSGLGDVVLPLAEREAVRVPVALGALASAPPRPAAARARQAPMRKTTARRGGA